MDLHLSGKHVLITGGSKGIGLACAQAFLSEGARVSLVSRSETNLANARSQLDAYNKDCLRTYTADLTQASSAETALEAAITGLGPIDILVNSAGAAKRTPAAELTPQAWQDAMDAKFFSYINMINPVIQQMGQRGRGSVVNVIGNGGKVPSSIHLPGGAANAALMLATAGLANAYAAKGVRVNAINPGLTRTERLKEGMAADARLQGIEAEEAMKRALVKIPMGRMAEPEDIARVVLFLASDAASYVTGINMSMDGATTPIVV
jgi:NAD(P)-dependent dehydrogenase (short-subunit alcohol dehydrogenase family)